MDAVHAAIARLASRQHGLITLAQAFERGLTPDAVAWLVRTGRWVRVASGVYRLNGTPLTWRGRTLALCLAAGSDAVTSHRTAAAVWGLDGFEPPRVEDLTVPVGRRPRVYGARPHQSRHYEVLGLTTRDGIPVTGPARTVLDVCAVSRNPQIGLRALDDVRRRRLATWGELWACHDAHARRGVRGLRTFRALLERRSGKEVPDTTFEALVQELLVGAGLPEPEPRVWVSAGGHRYRLDLAYRELRIDIECHSKEWHLNEAAFEADPIRDNALAVAGWLILHFTHQRFRDDPGGIVSDVERAISGRRLAVGG